MVCSHSAGIILNRGGAAIFDNCSEHEPVNVASVKGYICGSRTDPTRK
jgi:hypothetical protein